MSDSPKTFELELRPRIPERLQRLTELASNLMYSWDRRIRGLFWRLDSELWRDCGNNPKLFLQRVAQDTLEGAAEDRDFLEDYHAALASYDIYLSTATSADVAEHLDPAADLVAYFCAEYGFHDSVPIYSGGLGILAGDFCKAASDLRMPLVAVGLMYRQGYFTQHIDAQGQQQALYAPVPPENLPIGPARDGDGRELRVQVPISGRDVSLRIWLGRVGHAQLLLLDSDVDANEPADRAITYQLYGGGADMRIRQEIVLGIGGVRALRALQLAPTIWHANEGHAALMVLERVREHVARGLAFDAAVEWVAGGTVFTTHTAVAAGHDRFPPEVIRERLGDYLGGFKVAVEEVLALGSEPASPSFNLTALALRGSRHANGVSAIHSRVASEMERYIWPQIAPVDNPLRSVTNGVHLPTFIAREWWNLFHDSFREWTKHVLDEPYWQRIHDIPYHRFVGVRQTLKRELLGEVLRRIGRQHRRNGASEAMIARATQHIRDVNSNALVMGFARRFATYKRATLLLRDRARLARLLNDPARPAILIFAGKAHPHDGPGQALIRELHQASLAPDLIGRLLVVEGYDMQFARHLVQGCDIWINAPEYPLEACGTSGMKAAFNGVVNVSVLDGWWAEAYDGSNGFAVTPVGEREDAQLRHDEEAQQLLDILEMEVAPRYYGADNRGWSEEWVKLSQRCMASIIPRFNARRMLQDYLRLQYGPAARHARALGVGDGAAAAELAQWKRRVRERWSGVSLQLSPPPPPSLNAGERLRLRVAVDLNGLSPQDLALECVIGRVDRDGEFRHELALRFAAGTQADGKAMFDLEVEPLSGLQHYRIRAYPAHALLGHPFEVGCMTWL